MIDGGLRALFRQYLPAFHWVSVETSGTGRGIPDSEYCSEGCTGWIEFKVTDGFAVTLRPEQVAFLQRRGRAGGRVWVAVRRKHQGGPRKGHAVDELWLLRGSMAAQARDGGLVIGADYVVAGWCGGPSHWDWAQIAAILRSG